MAKYFNTSKVTHTLTFENNKVVRFPSKKWSEDIPRDNEGHSGLLTLVRKQVLRRSPLARLGSDADSMAAADPMQQYVKAEEASEE